MLVSCWQASPKDMCCRGLSVAGGTTELLGGSETQLGSTHVQVIETGREVSQVHGRGGSPQPG